MRSIAELIADSPAFAGLRAAPPRADRRLRRRTPASRPATPLFRAGEPADRFFLIRHGSVALELAVPQHEPLTIETLHDGEVRRLVVAVRAAPLGLRRARASRTRRAIAFDGACLRGKCDADHELGYQLMRRFAAVLVDRLQATRLQLLDVYGGRPRRLSRAATMVPDGVPRGRDGARTRRTRGRWSSRGRRRSSSSPGQFTMLGAAGLRRGADLDQRRPRRPGAARAHGARGRRRHGGDLRRRAGPRARRARAVRPAVAGRRRRGRRRGGRRRRHRPRAAAAGDPAAARAARALRPDRRALRRAHARHSSSTPSELRWAGARRVTVDAAGRDWRGRVGVVHEADRRARRSTPAARWR